MPDLGLATPADMGFVTFDELTVDDLFSPVITTLVQPADEIGSKAAELLLRRIGGTSPQEICTIRLPLSLRIRDSSRTRSAAAKDSRAD